MTPAERRKRIEELRKELATMPLNLFPEVALSHEDISLLFSELDKRDEALRLIMSMAGNPDAAKGCRIIIAKAREALGDPK